MKEKLFIIASIALILIATMPVSAVSYFTVNFTYASVVSENWNRNSTVNTSESASSLCSLGGWTKSFDNEYLMYAESNWSHQWAALRNVPSHPGSLSMTPDAIDAAVYPYAAWVAACNGGVYAVHEIHRYYNVSTDYPPASQPIVNFTGYPLDGYAPLDVGFTIQNFSGINSTKLNTWTFGDGQTANANSSTINHTYSSPGIYTVSLGYYNLTGTYFTITRTNYILTSLASGMIVNLDVKDAISGALIQDSTVGIRNTSSGVWRNTTAPTGLVYFSTTDPGYLYPLTLNQSITLAANKTGYGPASVTFNIPYNDYRARLFLMPLTVVNATGTGTVVANVIRNKDGLTASGISVVMDTGQAGITNSAGTTTLYNVSSGTRYATVTDPDGGYQSTKYAFNLTAGETKLIVIQLVRVGETPVPTFGSPTPTPTRTYDPNDPTSPVYGNYTASQINEQGGAGVLGMLMELIQLWPIVVIGAFMKFLKSAFS